MPLLDTASKQALHAVHNRAHQQKHFLVSINYGYAIAEVMYQDPGPQLKNWHITCSLIESSH